MIELTIYGLAGLAATTVVAFYFVCRDQFRLKGEGPSLDPSGYGDCGGYGKGRGAVYCHCGNTEDSHV
jgi:hypothetical protein